MIEEKLNKILENHKHWLNADCEGWEDMKANLSYINLQGVDLSGVDLHFANLSFADLSYADLTNVDLSYTNLYGANLHKANLRYARLSGTYLSKINLRDAKLFGADLHYADLSFANLSNADLSNANLFGADLRYADFSFARLLDTELKGANIYDTNFSHVNLTSAKNISFVPYVCPDTGSFIGYKKAGRMIVKLEIPEDAKRLSATSRKCRCNKAKVLGIYDYERNLLEDKEVASDRDKDFIYRVGEIVEVENFDENRWNECSTGIHFFINFEEAVRY